MQNWSETSIAINLVSPWLAEFIVILHKLILKVHRFFDIFDTFDVNFLNNFRSFRWSCYWLIVYFLILVEWFQKFFKTIYLNINFLLANVGWRATLLSLNCQLLLQDFDLLLERLNFVIFVADLFILRL